MLYYPQHIERGQPVTQDDRLRLEYIPLDQASLCDTNPKIHDKPGIKASFRQHGFKDPPKYEPHLNDGQGGLVEGNGRSLCLREMRDAGEPPPRGILTTDGHCSWSPERHGLPLQDGRAPATSVVANARPGAKTGGACRRWILTDTYPDQERMRTLILYCVEDNRRVDVGRFFAPTELDGEIRCDLHPRWSRDGLQGSFDSAHEGTRQMYVIDVSAILAQG